MASTIKLKNSNTAGNAPSSLEQGEVAINVADGNLFYGNGSSVLQNFTFNHITASGLISASGNIITPQLHFGGIGTNATSPVFLTHLETGDNLQIVNGGLVVTTGNITASGNISSSGTVTANSASLSGRIDVSGRSQFGSTSAAQTSHQFRGISGDTNVFSLFDKDGDEMININGVIGDNTSNFTIGDIGAAGNGTLIKIEDHNNRTFITNDASDGFFGINTTTPDKALVVMGDVSASGTITMLTASSGNVITTDITVDNDIILNNNSRIVAKNNPSQTFIELQNDDGFKLEANNTPVFSAFSNGIVFNEEGAAQADFRIESDNDTHIFFVDSGNDKVAIGTGTVNSRWRYNCNKYNSFR